MTNQNVTLCQLTYEREAWHHRLTVKAGRLANQNTTFSLLTKQQEVWHHREA